MKTIAKNGFNHQLNLIFRNSIEITDICLACITNESFYNIYSSHPETEYEAKIKWNNTRPSKLNKIIKSEFNKIEELHDFWDTLREIKESLYKKTSSFVHGNVFRIFHESISEEINKKNYACLTQFGLITKDLQETYFEIIIYSKLFMDSVIIFLVKNHGLSFNMFEQDGRNHIFLSSVNKKILKDFMKKHKTIWNQA